jgi:hypothetical protein
MSRKRKRRETEEERLARIDPWYRELEAAAVRIDPEDDRRLQEAIQEIRRQAKEEARRELKLP